MNIFRKIVLGVMMLLFTACASPVDDGKVHVTTTVGMLADALENIGGDLIVVEGLMGPGVDPHLYNPSAGDINKMKNADVVFYVGLHLEGKMIEIFESLGERAVAATANVSEEKLLSGDALGVAHDPHIWFDVDLWSGIVPVIEDKLVKLDPENESTYRANAAIYLNKLKDLDVWVKTTTLDLPKESRVLVTAHDAFSYFGKAYDFEVKGLQGISTASDFGVKDLEILVDFIVERQIKAIFVESSVSPKSIEALVEGVQSRGWDVVIGGELFSDAMGDGGTFEGTYEGMVKHNVNTIVNALK